MADTPDFKENNIEIESETRLDQNFGMVESVSATPTYTPTKFSESFATLGDQLCVYDWGTNTWNCMTTTTIGGAGESTLDGPVTLTGGTGIDLTQAAQDITIDGTTVAKSGSTALNGAVTLSEGAGISLTQTSQDIEIKRQFNMYTSFVDTSYTLAEAEVKDFTITCNFEPMAIIGSMRFKDGSTGWTSSQFLGTNISTPGHFPFKWVNPTYKASGSSTYEGIQNNSADDAEHNGSYIFYVQDGAGNNTAGLSITSTTSTGFDFTLSRLSTNPAGTNFKVWWQLQYIVLG